ncbi:MAG: hypothetical protein HQL08_08260 [Nitrospirae bacterium]|nr:hypothetical protein [Nitrospirota bacterium]
MVRLFDLLRKKRENNFELACPRCCREMSVSILKKDGTDNYLEIHRTYRCKKCATEYSSLELLAPLNGIPSLFGSVSELCTSVSEFASALKVLHTLTLDFEKDVVRKFPDAKSMN